MPSIQPSGCRGAAPAASTRSGPTRPPSVGRGPARRRAAQVRRRTMPRGRPELRPVLGPKAHSAGSGCRSGVQPIARRRRRRRRRREKQSRGSRGDGGSQLALGVEVAPEQGTPRANPERGASPARSRGLGPFGLRAIAQFVGSNCAAIRETTPEASHPQTPTALHRVSHQRSDCTIRPRELCNCAIRGQATSQASGRTPYSESGSGSCTPREWLARGVPGALA